MIAAYVLHRAALCLTCVALAGCQTTRYVTVPCLTPAQYDELAKRLPPKVRDQLTGHADEDVRTIAASNVRLRGYGEGLLEVLKGCTGK